ncbi:MAG: ribokinase [Bacteroidales bacterium]
MKKITVIGSSNVDMIIKLKRLPQPGETLNDGVFTQVFGGKGANQAIAAVRAAEPSTSVSFITCLGDDDFAIRMIESFRKDRLNLNFSFAEKGVATGTALILVDEKGTNSIAVAPGANCSLSRKQIDLSIEEIRNAEYIILQMEIPVDITRYIIDMADKLHRKVILNVAPAIMIENSYLSKTEILIVNETEASLLAGINVDTDENIAKAAETLRNKGVKTVIITLGAKGSYLDESKMQKFMPGFKVNAVDTTAAGDTYCGALAVALSEGKPVADAIKFAGAAAAISVTRLGAQPSVPFRKEIDEFLESQS